VPATNYPVTSTIIGSKVRHVVELPDGRTATLVLQTIPDEPHYEYRGYANVLQYEGDRLVDAEKRDRERHEKYNREFDAMRAAQRQAQVDLVAKFAGGDIKPRDVGMTPQLNMDSPKVTYARTPWEPKPFGNGDWVLVGEDQALGQIWGEPRTSEMSIVIDLPDGRTHIVYATGDKKTGRWTCENAPLVRTPEPEAAAD
jgi:hypothetical protein